MNLNIIFCILVAVIGAFIVIFLKVKSSTGGPKKIVLCGMPDAGKTTLYQYLMNHTVIKTVKSSQITDFTGYLDVNPTQQVTLIDLPSDNRSYKSFDFQNTKTILFLAKEGSKDAIIRLSNIAAQLHKNTKIFTNINFTIEENSEFIKDLQKEYARINGADEVDFPFAIEYLNIQYQDFEKFDEQLHQFIASK